MSILSENFEHDVKFITMLTGFCSGDSAYQDIFINYFKQYGLKHVEAVDSCFICFQQCNVDGTLKYRLITRKSVNSKVYHEVCTSWWSTSQLQTRSQSMWLFYRGLGCDVVYPIPEHLFDLIWEYVKKQNKTNDEI